MIYERNSDSTGWIQYTSGVFLVAERGFARVLAPTLDVRTNESPWDVRLDCSASPLLYPLDMSSEDLMLLKRQPFTIARPIHSTQQKVTLLTLSWLSALWTAVV